MDANHREGLIATYRDGLLTDSLPFWLKHGPDPKYGGLLTSLAQDGTVIDTDKSVWQQCRFTWLLGELYNQVEQRDEWLTIALQNADFIERNCFDPTDGRMWFLVTRDGKPIRKRRYAFSECFAAIAFGELAQATGESRHRQTAERLFRQFVDHWNGNPVQPKFTETRPMKSLSPRMMTIATAQELRDSIQLADANHWIDKCIDEIRHDFIDQERQCVFETVGGKGEFLDHFDGRTLNPGHALEAAWFIMHEGHQRHDPVLIEFGCQMLDWMWVRGWDTQYGGILYFVDVKGLPVQEYWHDMKFWWPHNEAIIATLLAFRLTGDNRYAEWHRMVHDWAYLHFPDPEHGEWFGYLSRDGRVSSTAKGNHWKGPFHLLRMQLRCWQIASALD